MKSSNISKLRQKFDPYLKGEGGCINLVNCKNKVSLKDKRIEKGKDKVVSCYDVQATIKSKNQPIKPICLHKGHLTPEINLNSTAESNSRKEEVKESPIVYVPSSKQIKSSSSSKLFIIKPTKYVFTRTPTEISGEVFQDYFAGSSFSHRIQKTEKSQHCILEYWLEGCRNSVNCIQGDGYNLFTGDSHCSVLRWSLPKQSSSEYFAKSYQKGTVINSSQSLYSHKKTVTSLETINNSLLSTSLDGVVKIFQGSKSPVHSIKVTQGAKLMKKLSNDKFFTAGSCIEFFDINTCKPFRQATDFQGVISSTVHTVFTFLTGNEDSSSIIWDARTPRYISKFIGHKGPVTGITMSSGFTFLTCSEDNSLKEWDLRTSSEISSRKSEGPLKEVLIKDNFILTGGRFLTVWTAETSEVVSFQSVPVKSLYLDLPSDLIFVGGYNGSLSSMSLKAF